MKILAIRRQASKYLVERHFNPILLGCVRWHLLTPLVNCSLLAVTQRSQKSLKHYPVGGTRLVLVGTFSEEFVPWNFVDIFTKL